MRTKTRITSVNVDEKFTLRLQELGIRPGAEVVAVSRAAFGGLVLNVAGTRIAVDHRSAKHIHVEPSDSPQPASKEVLSRPAVRVRATGKVNTLPTPAV